MKTKLQTLILLFLFVAPLFSQEDFTVIKVNGSILLKARGISLETGTVFSAKEDLLFRSEDATAAVINAQKGRIVLSSKNRDLSAASTNQMPSMYSIGTRGAVVPEEFTLSSYFSGKHVVLDKEMIEVDGIEYPMNSDQYFFLRYNYKGEEINKKLGFSGDTLCIDKTTLFTVDGNPIPNAENTLIKLFYRKGKESVLISEFDLIFPDMDQLKKEVEIILSQISGKTTDGKVREIKSYLNDFYGSASLTNISRWLETNFGIK
jgi:hypothetical protein